MAITLAKPLGTDVYSIDVFNDNATIIEQTINNVLQSIIGINAELPKKYNIVYITTEDTNIDDKNLTDGIYYLSVKPSGTLPPAMPNSNNILLVSKIETALFELLFTSAGVIYYRNINGDVVEEWKQITVAIVNDLNTQDETKALSAKQGYILNTNKLGIYFHNTDETNSIDLDNPEMGIHICDGITISGTIPEFIIIDNDSPENNHIILQTYGIVSETSVTQQLNDVNSNVQCTRFGYIDSGTQDWVWTPWQKLNSGDSSGGGSSILLELVDI